MELDRKNINRGFTKLRVWQHALELFSLTYDITKNFSFDLTKSRNNILDASNSILRNIAEGYCRRNLKEYLNFLNIALGSAGELYSGMYSFKEIDKISEVEFYEFDELHYRVENELISLIKSLQKKQKDGVWQATFLKG